MNNSPNSARLNLNRSPTQRNSSLGILADNDYSNQQLSVMNHPLEPRTGDTLINMQSNLIDHLTLHDNTSRKLLDGEISKFNSPIG